MHYSSESSAYREPTAKDLADRLGATGLIVLAQDPPHARREYSLQSENGADVTAEVRYIRLEDYELMESVRNWSTDKSLSRTYPDAQTRVDEHFMDFLANVRHFEGVVDSFTSAARSGKTRTVTVDDAAVAAELWTYDDEAAISFTFESLLITYVLPSGADTAQFTVTTE